MSSWVEDGNGVWTLTIGMMRAVVAHYSDGDYVWWIDGGGHGKIGPLSPPDSLVGAKHAAGEHVHKMYAELSAHLAPMLRWRRDKQSQSPRWIGLIDGNEFFELAATDDDWAVSVRFFDQGMRRIVRPIAVTDGIGANRREAEAALRAMGVAFCAES